MKYLVVLILFLSNSVFADYKVKGATVTKLSLSNSFAPGTVFIKVEGGDVTSPKNDCASTSWSFTHKVDESELSKAQFSMLLSAQASKAKVNLTGSGDCRVGYGVETLFTIELGE